jgi:hypothetical protein
MQEPLMKDLAYRDQLQAPDEAFLDQLRLPGEAGRALASGRAEGADKTIAVVADYFRHRKSPAWSYYMHGTPWHETDAPGSVLRKAERLLSHGFTNSWPPHQEFELQAPGGEGPAAGEGDPDWRAGLKQAPTAIPRGTFVTELSTAFALTGNAAFVTKAMALMRSYVAHLPFVLHPRFEEDHDQYFGGESNQTLHVAYRMFRWIDFLHSGAFHARNSDGGYVLSDADLFWTVKQLWFWAMQYYRLLDDPLRRDNHHLVDHGHTPFVTGAAFPEFAASREMVTQGAKVIQHHFGGNLLKDGAYSEHSAEYQYHILYHFCHPLGVAQATGIKLFSGKQSAMLRKWVQFSLHAAKPNGYLPAIGDANGRPIVYLFGSLAGPIMTPELASAAKALGIPPGRNVMNSMADIARQMKAVKPGQPGKIGLSAYFLSKGKTTPGKCKEPTTSQYPFGGYTFFRSDWTPDADYLAVSHYPPDILPGHTHWDPMSFILHTKGRTLIGDPASNLYEDRRFHGHGGESPTPPPGGWPKPTLHRGYSYSVNAHNCLVMNDDFLKNLEAMNHGTFWGGYPPVHHTGIFEPGGPIEVAEIWNDANAPTRHRRFVIRVQGIGFAFVDIITSSKPRMIPSQYSQYFHLEGDVEISPELPEPGAAMKIFQDDASCVLVPGGEVDTRWRSFRDEYLDNLYRVPNSKGLPWVVELTRRIRGEAVFTTFLLTHAGSAESRAKYLGQSQATYFDWQHEALSVNSLDLGDKGTLLIGSCPFGKTLSGPDLATDAELAVVLLGANHRPKAWAVARGGSLAINGKTLLKGKEREWSQG